MSRSELVELKLEISKLKHQVAVLTRIMSNALEDLALALDNQAGEDDDVSNI
jgi:hypothetical protein